MNTVTPHIDGALEEKEKPVSGWISRLPKPVQGVMLATMGAATLAATPEAQTATIFPTISVLPHVTTAPAGVPTIENHGGSEYSRLYMERWPQWVPIVGISSSTITFDTITEPGSVTMTFVDRVGTWSSFSKIGSWYPDQLFEADHEVHFGREWEPMTTISLLDSLPHVNNGTGGINSSEGFVIEETRSYTFPVFPGDRFIMENELRSTNTSAASGMSNPTFNYTPVPEPSTLAALSVMFAGGLLIRNRWPKGTTSTN